MAHGRISLEQALNSDNFYQLPKVIIGTKYYSKLKAEAKLLFMLCRDRLSASLDSTRKGDMRFIDADGDIFIYYAIDDLAIKAEAKLLFMLCRDRLSASLDSTRKGDMRFIDADGDIFIYYAIDDLASDLGCGRKKVMKLKKELIEYGLIDEVRQGLNKANRIYVKNVITNIQILNMEFEEAKELLKPVKSTEVSKRDFQKYQNDTSRSVKKGLHEVSKKDSTYIKQSETKKSDIKVIYSEEEEDLTMLVRKVDKVTHYDKEYIWELVHDQLIKDKFTNTTADIAMLHFESRYEYALNHMNYIHSAEQLAEYVLVHDQLIKDKFTNTTADIAMLHFESRYEYALNHMNYIHSAEQLAEYVYNGILLIKDKFTNTTADIAMLHFESRYEYALNHMNYIHSAEQLAEYVYNGILSEWTQSVRGKKGVG